MSNIKEPLLSLHDAPGVLRDIHNEEDRAIRVLSANDLVPNRFSKVVCTYVTSGNGIGEVATATYYDDGVKQLSSFVPNGEVEGRQEITYVNFGNVPASSLHNKYFVVYDASGTVGVYFIVDGAASVAPVTLRTIAIPISSLDDGRIMAIKTKQIIEADSEFLGLTSNKTVLIICNAVGNKPDSYDVDTGLSISKVQGESSVTLNNKYFFIWSPSSKFHVWYNVDSTGVDPAPVASTGIEVVISASSSRQEVLTATVTAINNTIYFSAYNKHGRVNVYSKQAGPTTAIQDVNTRFNFFETEVVGVDKKIIKTLTLTYDASDNLVEIDSF